MRDYGRPVPEFVDRFGPAYRAELAHFIEQCRRGRALLGESQRRLESNGSHRRRAAIAMEARPDPPVPLMFRWSLLHAGEFPYNPL